MTAFGVALVAVVLLTPVVIRAARRSDLLDVPNHRSSHATPVPRGGGVAVACATVGGLVAAAAIESTWTRQIGALVVCAAVLSAVGLVDDRRGLPAVPRLVVQLVVPAAAGVVAEPEHPLGVAVIVALVVVAGYVNAFNFMDGINGISGSQAAIAGVFLAVVADDIGEPTMMWSGLAVAGAALGFLPYNLVRAKIFLGDVGSYFLGAWLAGLALLVVDAGAPVAVVVTPFVLYLGDTSSTVLRRARRGEPLMEAHREHVYQRLVQLGCSHLAVTGWCAAIVAVPSTVALVVLDQSTGAHVGALAFALCCLALYLALPGIVARTSAGTGALP